MTLDLPGVGRNLHDHVLVPGIVFPVREATNMPISAFNHGEGMLFHRETPGAGAPDTLIMCLTVPFPADGQTGIPDEAFTLVPCLMAPASRGEIKLNAADPAAPPAINPNYLADPRDVATLSAGIELARELGRSIGLSYWRATDREIAGADLAAADLARRNASSF